MKTKLTTIVVVLITLTTAIIAQQYERVMKIYKGNEVITYKVSEIDSVKFDKTFLPGQITICGMAFIFLPPHSHSSPQRLG